MNYQVTVKLDPHLVYALFTGADLASTAGKAIAELCITGVYIITGAPTATAGLYIPGATVHNTVDGTEYLNTGTTASPVWKLISHA